MPTLDPMPDSSLDLRTDILLLRDLQGLPHAVLLEAGQAVEWLRPLPDGAAAVKDILLGRVDSIDRGLQRVFVDIGQVENGFLPLKEVPAGCKPGHLLVVQIRRLTGQAIKGTNTSENSPSSPASSPTSSPASSKGHLLTTRLQLPGPFLVFEPQGETWITRSKTRLLDPALRETVLARERASLLTRAQLLTTAAANPGTGPVPRLLWRPRDPLTAALQDWTRPDLATIQAADLDLFNTADAWLSDHWPTLKPRLKLAAGTFDLAEVHRVGDLAREAQRRQIHLKNGGSIVLEQTEALLVIDVNSGKAQAADNAKLRLQTNLQAAREIARQLRLRNISGLVVIDFIRLAEAGAQSELAEQFKVALDRDPARLTRGGFTKLGLYELIRQTR